MKPIHRDINRRLRWLVFSALWLIGCGAYFASYLWWSGKNPPLSHIMLVFIKIGTAAIAFSLLVGRITVLVIGFVSCLIAFPMVFQIVTILDANHESGRTIAVWLVLLVMLIGFGLTWIADTLAD